MDQPLLPDDFKKFLKLLDAHRVDYLGGGGYAIDFTAVASGLGIQLVSASRTDQTGRQFMPRVGGAIPLPFDAAQNSPHVQAIHVVVTPR